MHVGVPLLTLLDRKVADKASLPLRLRMFRAFRVIQVSVSVQQVLLPVLLILQQVLQLLQQVRPITFRPFIQQPFRMPILMQHLRQHLQQFQHLKLFLRWRFRWDKFVSRFRWLLQLLRFLLFQLLLQMLVVKVSEPSFVPPVMLIQNFQMTSQLSLRWFRA